MQFEIVREEVYSFTPSNGEPEVHIWSGKLRKWLLEFGQNKVIELEFPWLTREEMVERHGLEEARMASMTDEEAKDPVIVGFWSDGTNILIDGAHRVAFLMGRGQNKIRGWAVPEAIWRDYTFEPDNVLAVHHKDGSMLEQRRVK
jgi:hypothetical protein